MWRNHPSVTSPLLNFSYQETLPLRLTMFFVVCVVLLAIGLLAFLALWVLDSFSLLYPSLSPSTATSSWRQMTNTEGTNQEQEISLESVKSCDSGLPSYEEAIERYWNSRENNEARGDQRASQHGMKQRISNKKILWGSKSKHVSIAWNIFILQTRKKLYNLTGGSCCGWVLESIPKWGNRLLGSVWELVCHRKV